MALIFRRKKIWVEIRDEIRQRREEAVSAAPRWLDQCEHAVTEFRRLKIATGGFQLRKQCVGCWELVGGAFKRETVPAFDQWPLVDEVARERQRREREGKAGERQQLLERYREEEQRAFWVYYNEHLNSQEWREKCRLKRERAGNVCEGCGLKPVNHVHHLTYDNLGDELLFELVALCVECHQKLHPHREIA